MNGIKLKKKSSFKIPWKGEQSYRRLKTSQKI
jgi:hypothetical protein